MGDDNFTKSSEDKTFNETDKLFKEDEKSLINSENKKLSELKKSTEELTEFSNDESLKLNEFVYYLFMEPTLKISLEDIKTNWKSINKASKGKAAAVVKANAYGMGILRIVEALLEAGCCYFYVANIFEGLKLRRKLKNL